MDNFPLYSLDGLDKKIKLILDEMKRVGFLIDKDMLCELEREVDKEIAKLTNKIIKYAKYSFNLNSSQQIAKLLFEDLQLPTGRKLKTGYSTDEVTLRRIKKLHPVVSLILEYRGLFKLKSTYLSSLQDHIANDGRIHSTFLPDIAATGRLVSRDPNLQNIPVRGSWGRRIRKAFISCDGNSLLTADYSQIDLRILAHLSQESKLIQSFKDKQDVHTITAMEIFNKNKENVTLDDRRIAKTVNFGIIYGMSAHGLSENLSIDQKQAAYFIETYFKKYSKVKSYLDSLKGKAIKNGYTETLGGKKRYIIELKSKKSFIKKAGERMAVNFPVQGSAAEIIDLAMVQIDLEMRKRKLASKMLLQIHDELLFEVPQEELKQITSIVKDKMENIVKLDVPLVVNIKTGKSWGEMEKLKKD